MKKLFLHIGFNKTGSTSIQKNLARNAEALKQQGIFFPFRPKAPYMQGRQHVPLAAAVPGRHVHWLRQHKRESLKTAFTTLRADLEEQDCNAAVLSTESFGGLDMDAAKVSWLTTQLPGYDISVIAYIRRQDAYFLSAYQQRIKAGGTAAFRFAQHETMPALRFDRRLAPWREVFGSDRVLVRPFDPRFWPKGELFYDFLATIGASRKGLTLAAPANEGLDYRAVEIMRQLNRLNAVTRKQDRPGYRQRRQSYRNLVKSLDQILPGLKRQKMALSKEQSAMLREHYQASNEAALVGTGITVNDFFPPPSADQAARLSGSPDTQMLLQIIAALSSPQQPSAF